MPSVKTEAYVDETLLESFPASDPPSFTGAHAGEPARPSEPEMSAIEPPPERALVKEEAPTDVRWAQAVARAQGGFWVATGLWPLVHLRSFEAVTGRKRDKWLVKTVGLLVTCVGLELLRGARQGRPSALLGASAAATLGAVDVVYVGKKRISKMYLLDAAVELALVGAWCLAGARTVMRGVAFGR
jgi:hypothetical protein